MTIAATARVLLFDGAQQPLRLESRDSPSPAPGEVLVRIRCCTICGSDLHSLAGDRPTDTPMVLGHEALGEVVATGGDVGYWSSDRVVAIGDRVTWGVAVSCGGCRPCQRGLPQKCQQLFKYGHTSVADGGCFSGGMAELCLLRPRTTILPVPPSLDDVVAAPANCATATAAAALRAAGPIEGNHVLVQGAGLVGLTACAMAREAGARVLMAEPDTTRRAAAMYWGAADVADPLDPEFPRRSREFTTGAGFDVAIEASGAEAALPQGLSALDFGGAYILVGSVSPSAPWPVDPQRIVFGLLRVQGVHNYTPADLSVALGFLERTVERFPFHETVASRHELEDHAAAVAAARDTSALRVALVPRG